MPSIRQETERETKPSVRDENSFDLPEIENRENVQPGHAIVYRTIEHAQENREIGEIVKLGRLHILLGRKLLVIPSAARNLVLWLSAGRGRFLAALGMTRPFKLQITRLPNYQFPNY